MLEFDDVVDVTEPVEWDIASLSVCLFYVGDRAVGACPSSREVIAGIVDADHFSAEAAVSVLSRGRLRQARLPSTSWSLHSNQSYAHEEATPVHSAPLSIVM
jgi:hypothetical protein